MDLDPLLLSRIQFGFTIAFHILFPSFTIGLASWLAVLEAMWLRTEREAYRTLYKFWVKIFAVSFGMGVVSGIVMSYQFGTNWSEFSRIAGNIMGPLMQYEVLTAFFLEASFLGIMLFGWDKVGPRLHFLATCMVALGTLLSTFWIISANSWMQTPAGYEMRDGVFIPADWWAIVFNPSFPNRLAHMGVAAYLTTAFVVAGVGAWYLLRRRHVEPARIMFSMALWFIAVFAPIQIVLGDLHGLSVLEHQPTKLAAIEGHWETHTDGAPLILFAIPDQEAQENHYEVAIPKLGSLILKHDWNGELLGLEEWPEEDHPPVAIVFWTFRIMVGLGFLMLGIGIASVVLRWRRRLYDSRWFQRACIVMIPSGFLAVLTGWITAEVGRQPFVVYGLLRTADAVSPISGATAMTSLVTFVVVYTIVFGAGTYYLVRLIAKGPGELEPIQPDERGKKPKRPLSVPDDSFEPAE